MLIHLQQKAVKPHRVIILGANSFVGTALIENLKQEKISHLALARPVYDFSNPEIIPTLVKLINKDDVVIHLATAMPNRMMTHEAFVENIGMAKHVSAIIEKTLCRQFIYFSSDAVYPASTEWISEKTTPHPDYLYGIMHLAREFIFKQALEKLSIPLLIVRATQIYGLHAKHYPYGPGQFCQTAKEQAKISLFGRGEEQRDFIEINDVIELLQLAMVYCSQGIINFATGRSLSFLELAEAICRQVNFKVACEHLSRTQPIWHRRFNIEALRNAFPQFQFSTLEKNLQKLIAVGSAPGSFEGHC